MLVSAGENFRRESWALAIRNAYTDLSVAKNFISSFPNASRLN